MRPKQNLFRAATRKPSPFTDMSKFARRLSPREFFLLQQKRLMKPLPAAPSLVPPDEPNAIPQVNRSSVEDSLLYPDPVLDPRAKQTPQPVVQRLVTGVLPERRRRKKEINLLPRAYQKKPETFFVRLPAGVMPSLAVFLSVCLILLSFFPLFSTLEAKRNSAGQVLGEATSAYEQLQRAQAALAASDFQAADDWLAAAYVGFGSALEHFQALGGAVDLLNGAPEARSLLLAAQQATLGLQYATSAVRGLSDVRLGPGGLYSHSGSELRLRLQEVFMNFQTGLDYFDQAGRAISGLDVNRVPENFRPRVIWAQEMLKQVEPPLRRSIALKELLLGFLSEQEKTYLLLFENNRELRPTGGFIGTYGVLRAKDGAIASLKIESVYDPDGQLKVAIAAPGPLQKYLTKTWAMRDSNWFFSFPDSARKAASFLALETGVTPDEVIAFTPEIFVRLLAITGPIDMPEYGETLNAENFVDTVQYQTSVAYDRALNQPKKFLADFTSRFLQRLAELQPQQWVAVLQQVTSALAQKNLLFYSAEPGRQGTYTDLNWAGAVRNVPGDYLAVVNTSVGAGKTDQEIRSEIGLTAEISTSGVQRNTLVIRRSRGPTAEKEFPVNRDYMRVYVPAGSKLVSASGFEEANYSAASLPGMLTDPDLLALDKNMVLDSASHAFSGTEAGKTVFSGWVSLAPENEAVITLVYDPPLAYNATAGTPQVYSLLIQKQPGAASTHFTSDVRLPAISSVVWSSSPQVEAAGDAFRYEGELDTDRAWGVIFSRNVQ